MKNFWPFNRPVSDMPDISPEETPAAELDESRLHKAWHYLGRHLARIPFAHNVLAAYYCALDRNTPMQVRVVLAGALAYFVLPLDAVPDVLALIGFTDDAGVLMTALMTVRRHILPRHSEAAAQALDKLKGKGTVEPPVCILNKIRTGKG